jgi:hypothetical protein
MTKENYQGGKPTLSFMELEWPAPFQGMWLFLMLTAQQTNYTGKLILLMLLVQE